MTRLKSETLDLKKKNDYLNQYVSKLLLAFKLSNIRGLPFKEPPQFNEITRKSLFSKLIEELKNEYPDNSLIRFQKVLIKFGFLNDGIDLFTTLINLYGEQIGAYYDTRDKKLYMISGLPLGKGLQDAILAHELTHLLQDQYYQIEKLLNPKSGTDDDQKLAYQALIEGDASLVTQLFYLKSMKFSFLFDLLSYFYIDQKEFNQAPFFLRENLLFPYIQGLDFINFIHIKNGFSGINQCYLNPPKSSEEILHPSKYLLHNDPPVKVSLPKNLKISSDYHLLEENVVGEFNIQVLFRKYFGENINKKIWEGWGGDRYQVFEKKESSSLILIWLIRWDTTPDAHEFFLSYNQLISRKYPGASLTKKDEFSSIYQLEKNVIYIGLNKNDVLTIEANTMDVLNELLISFEAFKNTTYNE